MSGETIVAIYDTPAHAKLAAADLREAGVPDGAISIQVGTIEPDHTAMTATAPREQGFWSKLFGGSPDHDTAVYDRSLRDGASVLIVNTPDQHVDRVMDIIESHQPIDIDERAVSYTASQTSAPPADARGMNTPAEQFSAPGPRVVNRGGARVRRFAVERKEK
ncbi:MAG: hypothetical protein M3N26_02370 [Pseudomonadota bacterium]|nr:hypothetical protein [Pseudomonadota bacterium]